MTTSLHTPDQPDSQKPPRATDFIDLAKKRNPPYKAIAGLLKSGRVIPFLGAGVNFPMRGPLESAWTEEAPFLPTGAELSFYLAGLSEFPSHDEHDCSDLAKVSSYYADVLGRDPLRDCLYKVFARNLPPAGIHSYLATLEKPLLIVTTNYDDLTEKAFEKAKRPYYLVSHLTDRQDWADAVVWWKYDPARQGDIRPDPVHPNELDHFIDLEASTVIYKMHGTVDCLRNEWNSYVITEDDYVDFLSRMTDKTALPAMFIEHFNDRHFLFLGYGLRDWNFRVVLRDLLKKVSAGRRRSWAIQSKPSMLEEALWDTRGVDIYDLDVNKFVEKLKVV